MDRPKLPCPSCVSAGQQRKEKSRRCRCVGVPAPDWGSVTCSLETRAFVTLSHGKGLEDQQREAWQRHQWCNAPGTILCRDSRQSRGRPSGSSVPSRSRPAVTARRQIGLAISRQTARERRGALSSSACSRISDFAKSQADGRSCPRSPTKFDATIPQRDLPELDGV
jgi:hypothetical protein